MKIPTPFQGAEVLRAEPCRFCGGRKAIMISETDYWDIRSAAFVKCTQCGLAQLDPMLSEEDTAKGCLAYYIEETLRCSMAEQKRNLIRNFRRGVLFGNSLRMRNYRPRDILELGPGSGYFLQGLKFVFPEVRITVMDINAEVLTLNKNQHGYETCNSIPENHIAALDHRFDLVIARDILEHVADIGGVIENVRKYLRPQGLFHFITPNGHEDIWKHYLTYRYLHKPSELLINHVNYFDGKGLLDYLVAHSFSAIDYYTSGLKPARRGTGWKIKPKLMAAVSEKRSADYYIRERKSELKEVVFDKKEVLNKGYIRRNRQLIARWISWYHHADLVRLDPKRNIGHEIYGLFKIN